MEKLSDHQIRRLKADAKKLATAKKIKLSAAQDELANQLGFKSFALLIHTANVQAYWPATEAGVQAALRAFLEELSDADLFRLTRFDGTIWVNHEDFITGRLTAESFEPLGKWMESTTRQYAWRHNLVIALTLEGMAEAYYFGEEGEFFDRCEQQEYSPERAREWLLEINTQGGIFDRIGQEVELRGVTEED